MSAIQIFPNREILQKIFRHLYRLTLIAGAVTQAIYLLTYSLTTIDYLLGLTVIPACLVAIKYPLIALPFICLTASLEELISSSSNFPLTTNLAIISLGMLASTRPLWIAGVCWTIMTLGMGYHHRLIYGNPWSYANVAMGLLIPIVIGILFLLQKEAASAKQAAEENKWLIYRNRLAEDIHDSVTHSLVQIKLLSETPECGKDEEKNRQIAKISVIALNQLRQLTVSVRESYEVPSRRYAPGKLTKTLRQISEDSSRLALNVDTKITGNTNLLSPKIEAEIAQICLELSTNMLKYARRNKPAKILIKIAETNLIICGYNAIESTEETIFPSSYQGNKNMVARVKRLGGQMHTGSDNDTWSVTITLPFPPHAGINPR